MMCSVIWILLRKAHIYTWTWTYLDANHRIRICDSRIGGYLHVWQPIFRTSAPITKLHPFGANAGESIVRHPDAGMPTIHRSTTRISFRLNRLGDESHINKHVIVWLGRLSWYIIVSMHFNTIVIVCNRGHLQSYYPWPNFCPEKCIIGDCNGIGMVFSPKNLKLFALEIMPISCSAVQKSRSISKPTVICCGCSRTASPSINARLSLPFKLARMISPPP